VCVRVCVRVRECVCVCEREREKRTYYLKYIFKTIESINNNSFCKNMLMWRK